MSNIELASFESRMATQILMMLYPLQKLTDPEITELRFDGGKRAGADRGYKVGRAYYDEGRLIGAATTRPISAYTVDATDEDRLFAAGAEFLARHPAETLGQRSEVILAGQDGMIRWICFIKKQRPKNVIAAGRLHSFYEFHCMEGDLDGWHEYGVRPIGFDKAGKGLPLKVSGMQGWSEQSCEPAIIAASIIEDAHRAGAIQATLEADAKISFPISMQDYKDFLAERDGYRNTPTRRRNPILHFCAEHSRKIGGKLVEVKSHVRGATEFDVGGMRLTLRVPKEWIEDTESAEL